MFRWNVSTFSQIVENYFNQILAISQSAINVEGAIKP